MNCNYFMVRELGYGNRLIKSDINKNTTQLQAVNLGKLNKQV